MKDTDIQIFLCSPTTDWEPIKDSAGMVRGRTPIYLTPKAERVTTHTAAPGAVFVATWVMAHAKPEELGPDGRYLLIKLPNGELWHVDSRASNCDSMCERCRKPFNHPDHHPQEVRGVAPGGEIKAVIDPRKCNYVDLFPKHRCWCRHGTPEAGDLHVDKVGATCGAGAGSINSKSFEGNSWHGFLHGGKLVKC